jgi:predicted nucleic acid-binding protein
MSGGRQSLYVAEPPAQYLIRPPIVIDCSVFAAFVFREDGGAEALARMLGKSLHAPHLLTVEMTSVAIKKSKLGLGELATEGIAQFEQADIKFHATNSGALLAMASQYQLTAYDASYLWLASELKCPLLTFDQGLGKAAKLHLSSFG